MGGGVCQALFFGWQTDTDADVYCIYTIDIYKREGVVDSGATFFRLWCGLDSRGVVQMSELGG